MVTHISLDASHVTIMKKRGSGRCRQAILVSCMALALFAAPSLGWAGDSHKHRLINQQRIQDLKEKVADLREKMKDHRHNGGGVPGTIQNLESRVAALETKVANMASFDPETLLQAMQSLQNQVTTLDGKVLTLDGKVTTLDGKTLAVETKLGDVEKKMIPGLEKYVSVNTNEMNGVKGPHVVFSGVNVHVQSGNEMKTTADTTSGLGNLIIGYNEANPAQVRTGSHNIVGGSQNGFSSYGGLVFGVGNRITGTYASVVGGENNTANGTSSSVLGGKTRSANWMNATSFQGALNCSPGC
ncbi:MAG: hypothetical protein HP497_07550 [Nitrospira sp.]|nr:hypothetical protein [Nitrospira sp.]